MSVRALLPGWWDPYYRDYFWVVVAVLGAVAVLLGILSLTAKEREKARGIWVPYKAWYVMAPIMLLSVVLGPRVFVVVTAVLSLSLITEFARGTGFHRDWLFMSVVYAGTVAVFAVGALWTYAVFASLPIFFITIILALPLLKNSYEGMLQRVALSILALTYLGWFPAHLALYTRFEHWFAYVPFLVIGTVLNDASAFMTGKLLGKHKLIPTISPGKTVEGLLGALVVDTAYVLAVRGWLPGFTPLLLVASIAVFWVGGTVGDLVVSVFKRDIGIKDFGRWIPGHGGLMDRFDSLMLTAPLLYHLLHNLLKV